MRALLAFLTAALLAALPAWAEDAPAPAVRTVAGKRPVAGDVPITAADVGAPQCIGTCVSWPEFLKQLQVVIPTASASDVRTAISDAPNGADYIELGGQIHACPSPSSAASACPLATTVKNLYGLTSGQMAGIFQAAGAVRSPLQPYALPTFAQVGAAAVDLSNVNPATGRAALGAAASDLSNVTVALVRLNVANPWSALQTFNGGVQLANNQAAVWTDTFGGLPALKLQSDNNFVFYGTNAAGSLYPVFSQPQHVDNSPLAFQVPLVLNADESVKYTGTYSPVASAMRGLPITPQMFGALGNSNGSPGSGNDDTAAFQAAINFVQSNGLTLRIPGLPMSAGATALRGMPQMYRLTSPLTITGRVVTDGDYCQPARDYGSTNLTALTPGPGSWLYFDHAGRGITVPADGLGSGNTGTATGFTSSVATTGVIMQKFCTYRNQPALVASGSWAPNANDYDLFVAQDDAQINDIVMLNPTKGLYVAGRYNLQRLKIGAYQVGITSPLSEDTPRQNDIHIWSWDNPKNAATSAYRRANLDALQLGRVDNPLITNFFAIGAKICLHVMADSGSGVANKVHVANMDCDLYGNTALLIEATGSTGQITNFTSQGSDPDPSTGLTSSYSAINVGGTNNHWGVTNFRSTGSGGAAVYATGAGNWLDLSGFVSLENWAWGGAHGTSGTAAVDAENGATIVLPAVPLYGPGSTSSTQVSAGSSGTIDKPSFSKVN